MGMGMVENLLSTMICDMHRMPLPADGASPNGESGLATVGQGLGENMRNGCGHV